MADDEVFGKVGRILQWLKAGYPEGIPPRDYPPVLGVLHRHLTDEEIIHIADHLALDSVSKGSQPVTTAQVMDMVRQHAFQTASDSDLNRVRGVLAAAGWPLADDLL